MKPRVLIIIATNMLGGPGKGLLQFLRHAEPGRFEYWLSNFLVRGRETEFIRVAREQGVRLRLLRQAFGLDPRPLAQAGRIVRENGCNIVQSHGYKGHVIGYVLSRLLSVRWVAVAHGWTNENLKIRFYNGLERWLLRRADVAVAVSPKLFETVRALRGAGRLTAYVPNAVGAEELVREVGAEGVRTRHGLDGSNAVLGVFGRLSPEKGQDVLLDALVRVCERHPACRLLIVGDGQEAKALREQAARLGLARNVVFCGYQRAVGDYLAAVDVVVLPSRSEGMPNVVLEAMCAGVPVVATDVGGVREIIDDGRTGWIVPPGDAQRLATRLLAVLDDRQGRARVAAAGQVSVASRFSPGERARLILEIYERVLAPGGAVAS